ncbi:stage 0 sporulation initiation phosphotransferase B [Sporolactobacillus sp. THM7-7]|nr:stage 0 sporulation initiation phosphotransferase B [Sporolactobacillus sp. THM7-7]
MVFDEEQGIRIIGSARHVLLNDLQIIKGYLSMRQAEKAAIVVDRITENLRHQARLSHLHIPKCSFFLLTYQWNPHPFSLMIHVSGPEKDLSRFDQMLTRFFSVLFSIFEEQASETADNQADVFFELNALPMRARIVFTGQLKCLGETAKSMELLEPNQFGNRVEHYISENGSNEEMRWTICLSIR